MQYCCKYEQDYLPDFSLTIPSHPSCPFQYPFLHLLSSTEPDPTTYLKVMELLDVQPKNCVMKSGHAYDRRARREGRHEHRVHTAYLGRTKGSHEQCEV